MIVLLTDFGLKDAYVGVMKGVISTIAPSTAIIDLTHHIEPQNIPHGNAILLDNYKYFPKQTIFCCVIDPGVGTNRNSIIIKNKDYTFIGPDNGLFSNLISKDSLIYLLKTPPQASNTFHGRDLYAPTSAKLCINQFSLENLDRLTSTSCCTIEQLSTSDQTIPHPQVIYSDHFGNLITNAKSINLPENFTVSIQNIKLPFVKTYHEIVDDKPAALYSSSGRLEIAVKNGSALDFFQSDYRELIIDILH